MDKLQRIFFLIGICFSQICFAQAPTQQFWALNRDKSESGLLDKITTTTASMAYSVRKLRAAYTGPAMRVRKGTGTDTVTANVRFSSNGTVTPYSMVTITTAGTSSGYTVGSTLAFHTFYGSSSVYVATWYDQSGNGRHVTQATLTKQPRIVNAGTLEVSNTKASIYFSNASQQILNVAASTAATLTSGYIGTASAVLEAATGNTAAFGFSPITTFRWEAFINFANNLYFDVGNTSNATYARYFFSNSDNVGLLRTYIMTASNTGTPRTQVFVSGNTPSGVTTQGTPSASPTLTTFNVGGDATYYHNGHQSEVIVFPIALGSVDISTINSDQKLFYGTP